MTRGRRVKRNRELLIKVNKLSAELLLASDAGGERGRLVAEADTELIDAIADALESIITEIAARTTTPKLRRPLRKGEP